jgi:hypothetical protein
LAERVADVINIATRKHADERYPDFQSLAAAFAQAGSP